jgi:hypothetical protein
MTEKKGKEPVDKQHDDNNLQPISRREFALGSIALLGAYSLAEPATLPPLSQEVQAWKLEKSNEVQNLMEARGILDEDMKRVIDHAEKTGEKLYQPEKDVLLAKLRVQSAYFYAEYSPIPGGFRIHAAYTHRFLYKGDQL